MNVCGGVPLQWKVRSPIPSNAFPNESAQSPLSRWPILDISDAKPVSLEGFHSALEAGLLVPKMLQSECVSSTFVDDPPFTYRHFPLCWLTISKSRADIRTNSQCCAGADGLHWWSSTSTSPVEPPRG